MKIKYKIKEIQPKIFLVTIDNPYDLAMTFCRVQEFYESPFKEIKGKTFKKALFQRLYSLKYGDGVFTYPHDWIGFNVPCTVIWDCYNASDNYDDFDLYDDTFIDIWDEIESSILNEGLYADEKFYVIGTGSNNKETIDHELCHAFYFLNKDYKKQADEITATIPKDMFDFLKNQLLDRGYCSKVVRDEIQAYLTTDVKTIANSKILNKLKKQIKQYKELFNKYKTLKED